MLKDRQYLAPQGASHAIRLEDFSAWELMEEKTLLVEFLSSWLVRLRVRSECNLQGLGKF